MKVWRILLLLVFCTNAVHADDLTKIIQEDLAAMGYDVGEASGERTVQTAIAISQFQAEYDLEVTGEPSPQLAGIIKAKMKKPAASQATATSTAAPAAAPAASPESLQAAQQECLQEKYESAQKSQQTKRGISSLISAVTRTAGQTGSSELAADISQTSSDVYDANATASDLSSAAKDLGLTESDIEACRNPL
jgi:hypothetical protein